MAIENGGNKEKAREAMQRRMSTLSGLAQEVLQAERKAWSEGGPNGLMGAQFSIRLSGLPPDATKVEIYSGIVGRVVMTTPQGALVQFKCHDVRMVLETELEAQMPTPDLGVSPVEIIQRMRQEEDRREVSKVRDGDG